MEWFWNAVAARRSFYEALWGAPQVLHFVDETFTSQNFPQSSEDTLRQQRRTWHQLLRRFQKYGHFSTGNLVTPLEGGDACFTEMLQAISLSQSRVWCESYIFDNSRVAEIFFTALRDAASRGLDVVLLVDYIGAFALRQDWVRELRSAGCDVVFFNPVLPASLCVGPISFRDHRKIMICDEVGFCTSVAERWAGNRYCLAKLLVMFDREPSRKLKILTYSWDWTCAGESIVVKQSNKEFVRDEQRHGHSQGF